MDFAACSDSLNCTWLYDGVTQPEASTAAPEPVNNTIPPPPPPPLPVPEVSCDKWEVAPKNESASTEGNGTGVPSNISVNASTGQEEKVPEKCIKDVRVEAFLTEDMLAGDMACAGCKLDCALCGKELRVDSTQGFEVGRTITINPGNKTQESHVIAGFASIILESQLRFNHSKGER